MDPVSQSMMHVRKILLVKDRRSKCALLFVLELIELNCEKPKCSLSVRKVIIFTVLVSKQNQTALQNVALQPLCKIYVL